MAAVNVKWMWGDAALFSSRVAKLNPLRWSRTRTIEQAIADLHHEAEQGVERPVRLLIRGAEGLESMGYQARDGDVSPRSMSSVWSQPASHGRSCALEQTFPTVAEAVAELQRLQASSGRLPGLPEGRVRPTPSGERASFNRSGSSLGKEAAPYRFHDLSAIPPDLLEGPFEDFEISNDVYTTAYLVARNATPDMYSFSPLKNPQVRIVWRYLCFIVGSQLFIIAMLTLWYPPMISGASSFVDCSNSTSLASIAEQGVIGNATQQDCVEAGEFVFRADVDGRPVDFYKVEQSVPFYEAILLEGSFSIYLLRVICCAWQFGQVYFEEFDSVRRLFDYHDFSQWFLPLKGEDLRPSLVLIIPLIQFAVLLIVTSVSFMVLCAQTEAFDIVMNSMAFTFIAQVGAFFNGPLAQHLGETYIRPPPYNNESIAYLYPEYSVTNAVGEDGSYSDCGWYICEDETGKAGLLSDYKIRHNPEKYEHHCRKIVNVLEWMLLCVPLFCVLAGAWWSGALSQLLSFLSFASPVAEGAKSLLGFVWDLVNCDLDFWGTGKQPGAEL